jgi:hypothetical protein
MPSRTPARDTKLLSVLTTALALLAAASRPGYLAHATDDLLEDWRYAVSRNLRFAQPAMRERAHADAIDLCERLLVRNGVSFRHARVHGEENPVFEILAIDADGASPLNRIAAHAAAQWEGLRLIYAPTVLMDGTAGFYSQQDHTLGLSNAMIEDETTDSTFAHEIIHAAHGTGRRLGRLDPLSPVARVKAPEIDVAVSQHARGYRRLQSFEELEAHAESVRVIANELPNALPAGATYDETRAIEQILGELQFSSTEGEAIAKATADLARRAIQKIREMSLLEWREVDAPASPSTSAVWETRVMLDGSRRGGSILYHERVQDAVELSWRIHLPAGAPKPTRDALLADLEKALELAEDLAPSYAATATSMFWFIERADARRTDFDKVRREADNLIRRTDSWRTRHRR